MHAVLGDEQDRTAHGRLLLLHADHQLVQHTIEFLTGRYQFEHAPLHFERGVRDAPIGAQRPIGGFLLGRHTITAQHLRPKVKNASDEFVNASTWQLSPATAIAFACGMKPNGSCSRYHTGGGGPEPSAEP
jgi:hypothetical protein